MNLKLINPLILILIQLVLVNKIDSFSILNDKTDEPTANRIDTSQENTFDDPNRYNYNLTDAELFGKDNKVDLYDFEQMEKSCCFLARLAAQRGFHCSLKFYSHKLLYRIRNRTHRKHIQIIGNNREQMKNKQLMLKFGKCLNGFTQTFEYCCWDEIDKELNY